MKIQLLVLALLIGCANAAHPAEATLEQGFHAVPDTAKPWVYWWWLNGNVDEQTITRDLEAMRMQGIGGLLLFDARGYHDDQNHVIMPPSRMEFMSPEWRRMVKYSLSEANRLGLQVSINLSSCAGALKGPWEVGDDAPKKLTWCATNATGPGRVMWRLPEAPAKRFWNIGLVAVRHQEASQITNGGWQEVSQKAATQPKVAEVVNLSGKVKGDELTWDVPAGNWTLIRFGCVTMAGHEYDVDVLDRGAVAGHFERMGKALLKDAGPLAGKTLTHFYSVSWEGAVPTWTLKLEKEFKHYRGYELRPWLPVLAGFTLKDREQSERFLRDYYLTLSDTFRENFYGTIEKLCHREGLLWHSESGGPWNRKLASFAEADQLAFLGRNDMPQGEFWFGAESKRALEMNRPPAMTAHIYEKPLAAAEAFTHMVQHWSAYPAVLKPFADAAFCDGINHFIWHTFTCSPPEFGKPGSEYFAGTHLNPNVTWFTHAGPFISYLARCQYMLRQGRFVSDVCVYVGDKPYQHWGRGSNWSEKATLRLPPGYTYDLMNSEVLLERLKVRNGDLVLPEGMSYRLLVVDLAEETASPSVLRKIEKFQKAGATVVFGQRKPQRAAGLTGYPKCDEDVRQLAGQLWKSSPTIEDAIKAKGLLPDFAGPCDYTHRRVGDTDAYFISGRGAVECTFRVNGRAPELWDAVSGRMSPAANWHVTDDGRTRVSFTLPQNGSTFVVFRAAGQSPQTAGTTPPAGIEKELTGAWTVQFEPGRGAPTEATFVQLVPWDTHANQGIKYFSGRATYKKAFEVSAEEAKRAVRLQLGEVRCVAQVRLNGRDLGIVWTDPWCVDLDGAVKAGRNELEIEVANTWVNRLIGDAGLPKEERITRSNLALQKGPRTLRNFQGFASEDPLMRSGLLGPVRLELAP